MLHAESRIMPADRSKVIWRYLDLWKFVHLLHSSSLYFARADSLDDKFEGAVTNRTFEARLKAIRATGWPDPEKIAESISRTRKRLMKAVAISCWHENSIESAAMWSVYGGRGASIAIRSTIGHLCDALEAHSNEIIVAHVSYVDYKKVIIPDGSMFYPFFFKQKSFEHERELRAACLLDIPAVPGTMDLDLDNGLIPHGVLIPIDLNSVINTVSVSPAAPQWQFELVQAIANRCSLRAIPTRSMLDEDPVF
ncbi:MAG: hypothetical protein IT424_06180 [Pirellulales bacterium]|nr:hypothetical protein [Pirellulales bacterium]